MALVDLVQDVTFYMSGLLWLQPKYASTFKKVDAGMVSNAGTSMYFSPMGRQPVQEEGVLRLQSIAIIGLTTHYLTAEDLNPLYAKLRDLPARTGGGQALCLLMWLTYSTALGI